MNCGSAFEPGASGLPYYCTPPVCVPDVIGALAVWRQIKKGKKGKGGLYRDPGHGVLMSGENKRTISWPKVNQLIHSLIL